MEGESGAEDMTGQRRDWCDDFTDDDGMEGDTDRREACVMMTSLSLWTIIVWQEILTGRGETGVMDCIDCGR